MAMCELGWFVGALPERLWSLVRTGHVFLVHVKVHHQIIFVHSNLLENVREYMGILKQIEALFAGCGVPDAGHDAMNHIEDFKAVRHFGHLG
jgi:hypothetical protein